MMSSGVRDLQIGLRLKMLSLCMKGINRPRVPLNENYYDLSKVENVRVASEIGP